MGFPVYALLSDLAVTMVLHPKHFHFLRLLYLAPPVAMLQSGGSVTTGGFTIFPSNGILPLQEGKAGPEPP